MSELLNYPNKTQRSLVDRLYYIKNRDLVLEKQSRYRKIHKEKYKVTRKRQYDANKEYILNQQSEYRKRRGKYTPPHVEFLNYIQGQRQYNQNPIYQYFRLQNDEQMPRKKEVDDIG